MRIGMARASGSGQLTWHVPCTRQTPAVHSAFVLHFGRLSFCQDCHALYFHTFVTLTLHLPNFNINTSFSTSLSKRHICVTSDRILVTEVKLLNWRRKSMSLLFYPWKTRFLFIIVTELERIRQSTMNLHMSPLLRKQCKGRGITLGRKLQSTDFTWQCPLIFDFHRRCGNGMNTCFADWVQP